MPARLRSLIVILSIALSGCVALDPASELNALMAEGEQLYASQRFDEAITRFQTVAAKAPNGYPAYLWLARSYMAKGMWPDAVSNARRARDLSGGTPDVVPVLLDALLGGGNDALARGLFVDSIGYFGEYLRYQPGNIRAWINVGKAYAGNRQFLDALNALVKAIQNSSGGERSEALQSLLGIGKDALQSGDFGNAVSVLREYLKFNSTDVSALLDLAQALKLLGR